MGPKGIAYFKDGHTEEITHYVELERTNSIMFNIPSGVHYYDKKIVRMDSGYLCVRHEFIGNVDGHLGIVPIERIVLL